MPEPKVTQMPVSAWTLLPPGHDKCPICAAQHSPEQPHNPQSLYWQTARNIAEKPPATWELALAHCPVEVRDSWIEALAEKGVIIDIAEVERLAKEQG